MAEKPLEESYNLEGIAFGLVDGLIMCLGLIIGIVEATSNTHLVIITGIIGGCSNAFGNSIGVYRSQSAERALQIQTINHGKTARVHSVKEIAVNTFLAFDSTIMATVILVCPFTCLSMNYAVFITFLSGE